MDPKNMPAPDPKLFERLKLLDDTLNYRHTDHVPTAPFV